jgi:hypothetical protein
VAIGINWAEAWAPVWGPVWRQAAAPDEEPGGGGQPGGKQGYSLLPDVYYTNTDEKDILTFIVSWTINHG